MSEKAFFYTVVGINVLLYILAFGLAFTKKQNMTFYVILLAIESLLILFWIVDSIGSDGGDAAGSGMAEGFYWLIMLAILIIFTLTLAITIPVKLNSPTVWKCLIATPFVLAALYGIYRIDFRGIYLKLLPITDETSLVWNEGIAFDKNGNRFTGRAKAHAKDVFFTEDCEIMPGRAPDDTPWLISNYKDGVVQGVLKYYAKTNEDELGIYGNRPTRTRYFGYMHVKNGKANGETLMNIPNDYNYNPCWKALYDNGKLICKKYLFELEDEWKENGRILQKPTWRDLQKQEKCQPADEIKDNKIIEKNEKTDELKPDSADTFINMGYEYYNKKEYKKAKECYEKAKGIMVK